MATETKDICVRPSWEQLFMNIASQVAKRSTCLRIQTGALLVKDNRIISMGYNGSVPNGEHCSDYWLRFYDTVDQAKFPRFATFVDSAEFYHAHHEWSIAHEIHGEQNAILYAARNGISTQNSEMYTLYSPCINCAKVMVTAGVKKVFYSKHYKRDTRGVAFLERSEIPCVLIQQSDTL
jgi:dCMP deaminase